MKNMANISGQAVMEAAWFANDATNAVGEVECTAKGPIEARGEGVMRGATITSEMRETWNVSGNSTRGL